MFVTLHALLEELHTVPGAKNASGNIQSYKELANRDSIAVLDQHHAGLYALLAFHPGVDSGITAYVEAGGLGSDAGSEILLLYSLDTATGGGSRAGLPWLQIEDGEHPCHRLVRDLPVKAVVAIPCVVVFERLGSAVAPVIISLPNSASAEPVRQRMRQVMQLASDVSRGHVITQGASVSTLPHLLSAIFDRRDAELRGWIASVEAWQSCTAELAGTGASLAALVYSLLGALERFGVTEDEILASLAFEEPAWAREIAALRVGRPEAAAPQGEPGFPRRLASALRRQGVSCVVSAKFDMAGWLERGTRHLRGQSMEIVTPLML